MQRGDLIILGQLWIERKGRIDFSHQLNGGETDSATRLGECCGVGVDALEIQG